MRVSRLRINIPAAGGGGQEAYAAIRLLEENDMRLAKYGQAKTVTFSLYLADGTGIQPAAAFVAGDVKISKDEGVEQNVTNLPTDEGQGYSILLTATEMQAARIRITIVDQTATQTWLDCELHIETYGNASAEHAFDLDTASVAQTGDSYAIVNHGSYGNAQLVRATTPANTLDVAATGEVGLDFANYNGTITAAMIAASALNGKGDWNVGKTGYTLTQAFPANFSDLAITVTTGRVTVGTNADKTGYSISGAKQTLDALNDLSAAAVNAEADTALSDFFTSAAALVDLIYDEATAGHVGAGTFGKAIGDILGDTNELQTDWVNGGRLDLILDSLVTAVVTAAGNPAQGAPPNSADRMTKIDYIYKFLTNKTRQSSTTLEVYNDAGTVVDHKSTVSDDGTYAIVGKFVSGP